jgi:hypothetical protein
VIQRLPQMLAVVARAKFGDKAPADPVMVGGLKFLTH